MKILYDQHLNCTIDLRDVKFSTQSADVLAKNAVSRIVKNYPPPYTLFASGGVDSQAMIWAWHLSGVEYRVVAVRFENNFNEHDLRNLQQWSKQYKIEVDYLNFEVLPFLDNMEEYVLKYQCTSPQICTHMAMTNLVPNGTILFSGNPIFYPNAPFFKLSTGLNNTILGLHRFSQISRSNLIPFFLSQDFEFSVSFDRDHDKLVGTNGYETKCKAFQNQGFPVIPQVEKYTGFEKIKDWCDEHLHHKVTPLMRNKYKIYPSKRTFDILYRYRWTDILKYKDEINYVY